MLKLGEQDINPVYLGETLIGKGFAGDTPVYSIDGDGGTPTPDPSTWPNKLKILCIGNSHSVDSWSYVPFILKQYNLDCLLVMCYYPAAKLADYIANFDDTTSWAIQALFYIDTATSTQWSNLLSASYLYNGESVSPSFAVNLTYEHIGNNNGSGQIPWDLICIQNSYTLYNSDKLTVQQVTDMFNNIDTHYSGNYKKGFTITHLQQYVSGSDVNTPEKYLTSIASVLTDESCPDIDIVFPCGGAIHRMRAIKTYRELYSRSIYRNLFEDGSNAQGVHLNAGLPCYIAASTIVAKLLEYYDNSRTLRSSLNTLVPDRNFDVNHNIPQLQGTVSCGTDARVWPTYKQDAIDVIEDTLEDPYGVVTPDEQCTVTLHAQGCDICVVNVSDVVQSVLCTDGNSTTIYVDMYDKWDTRLLYRPTNPNYTQIIEEINFKWDQEEVQFQAPKALTANTGYRRYHYNMCSNPVYYITATE